MRTLSLAARNLTRNARRTLLTALAIAFGLTMMYLVITLNSGSYREMMRQGISTMAGHVVIAHPDYTREGEVHQVVAGAAQRIADTRDALPHAIVAPRIYAAGLLSSTTGSVGVGLRGIDPEAEAQIVDLAGQVVDGAWLAPGDTRGVLIGRALAERLAVGLGDRVVFMGQGASGEMESRLFRVAGIFRSGGSELDAFLAISAIEPVQEVLGRPDTVHQITVHLPDARKADAARDALLPRMPEGVAVLTWREALPELIALIEMDRVSSDIMMGIIGVIVALGVLNTVLMSVLERTREFGVLLAIGLRPRRLAALVLAEGLVLGLGGTALGVACGLIASWPIVAWGVDYTSFVGETLEMEGLVMSAVMKGAWDPTRLSNYALAAVAMTVLSAVYPALHLMRLQPVDAMRGDR